MGDKALGGRAAASARERALTRDVAEALEASEAVLGELAGARVLVTGATGLLGSLLVRLLLIADAEGDLGLSVVAAGRSRERLAAAFEGLPGAERLQFAIGDAKEPLSVEGPLDYLVHGASPTSSRYFVEHPVDTIETTFEGTRNALELARRASVRGMVYLSSLEVYGDPRNGGRALSEDEDGYLDPLSVRSSYSEGKRLAETLCAAYASEFAVPVKVARLSQTFGAGVRYDDGRVFAEFMRCALEGRPISLHSEGRTTRTYCYTADALAAILFILVRGRAGEAYNVANEDARASITEMAEVASRVLAEGHVPVRREVPDNYADLGYNPEMLVCLDASKLRGLGWRPTVGLEEMFRRMAESFGWEDR